MAALHWMVQTSLLVSPFGNDNFAVDRTCVVSRLQTYVRRNEALKHHKTSGKITKIQNNVTSCLNTKNFEQQVR